MLKEPRPGRVKTRLGRDIGMTTAAWWFRHQTKDLIRRLKDPRWRLVLAVSPDREGRLSRVWPAHVPRMIQGSGNLGDRMTRALSHQHPGQVCLIGADIPGVTTSHIWRAFAALGASEAVFGPATDGGYWLVGLKNVRAVPAGIFADVRWSTAHALADSMASLPDLRIALLDELRDVDDGYDLRMTAQGARAT